MYLKTFVAFASAALALACSPTIDVGQDDGGSNPSGDGGGSDGGAEAPLSAAATSSPNFARCKVACAAPADDGPCASADVNACIEKCTAFTEGLSTGCAQCVVESSYYAGTQCVPSPCGARCPDVKCDYPSCSQSGCGGASGDPPPPCDPACTPSDETCDGFHFAKTTDSACSSLCQ
ncbi:MAG: hypothetical protein ABI183_16930 [Polyangiaceae bacterium]